MPPSSLPIIRSACHHPHCLFFINCLPALPAELQVSILASCNKFYLPLSSFLAQFCMPPSSLHVHGYCLPLLFFYKLRFIFDEPLRSDPTVNLFGVFKGTLA
jgi:hypothetical protein